MCICYCMCVVSLSCMFHRNFDLCMYDCIMSNCDCFVNVKCFGLHVFRVICFVCCLCLYFCDL